MFHVKHCLFYIIKALKNKRKAKEPYIFVRLFARGLDKEMGMSGTDAFASNWKAM